MSKRTNRVQVALAERPQPVGEIVFEADGRRQASVFRYAVEWLDNPERALGELRRLGDVLDVSKNDTGLMLDVEALPRRIRKPRPLVLGGKGLDEGKP